MLVMDESGLSGNDLAFTRFWNIAQSTDALLENWVLALWFSTPKKLPRQVPIKEGVPLAVFGWQGTPGEPVYACLPLQFVLDYPAQIRDTKEVVLTQHALPRSVEVVLERELGFRRALNRQRVGWWLDENEEALPVEPNYRPTGALLFERGSNPPGQALVLIEVAGLWMVLSELGAPPYRYGARLLDGENVLFAAKASSSRLSPELWLTIAQEPVAHVDVVSRFGQDISDRARTDAKALVVSVQAVK